MPRGGKRPGAGRPPGKLDRVTIRQREALLEAIAMLSTKERSCDPFLRTLEILRDHDEPEIVLKACQLLCDRIMPKLSAVKWSGDAEQPLQVIYTVTLGDDPPATNGHRVHGPGTTHPWEEKHG